MARIKAVINERRLAYEGAVRLVERQKEQHQDNIVLQHQISQYRKERKYLQRRHLFMERRNAERQEAREKAALKKSLPTSSSEVTDTDVIVEKKLPEVKPVSAESPKESEIRADVPSEQPTPQNAEPASPQTDGKNGKEQTVLAKGEEPQTKLPTLALDQTPSKPIEAAAAGLFGAAQVSKGSRRP